MICPPLLPDAELSPLAVISEFAPSVNELEASNSMMPPTDLHRVGLNESVLIHHLSAGQNRSGVGDQLAAIVDGAGRQRHLRAQAAAIGAFRKQHGLTSAQANVAGRSRDAALIVNIRANR